jgi:hypothetical protein
VVRIAIALGQVVALVVVVVAAAASHGGDKGLGNGELVWEHQPHVYRVGDLPHDRVLRGVVRNDSLRVITLSARDLGVRTTDGDELESATVFAPTFIRGVFPQNRSDGAPESEQLRVGLRARIEPGKTVPITVSWREHGKQGARVDYGNGSLSVPSGRASGA